MVLAGVLVIQACRCVEESAYSQLLRRKHGGYENYGESQRINPGRRRL